MSRNQSTTSGGPDGLAMAFAMCVLARGFRELGVVAFLIAVTPIVFQRLVIALVVARIRVDSTGDDSGNLVGP